MATPHYAGDGNPDGEILGRTGGKVGFFGKVPVEQQTSTALATVATSSAFGATQQGALNAVIEALKAYGLIP